VALFDRVDPVLGVAGLVKRFGDVVALDDVGFQVDPGTVVGLLGPNGAGKTTTMRAIMRLVSLDAGEVTWRGEPVTATTRAGFGYMPAERGMYQRMKVRDHLVYYGRLSGLPSDRAEADADRWIGRLGLAERAGDAIQTLSSGNQQRVQLALALLGAPELLVLDEPFSGLDPLAADTLREVVRALVADGAALLLSSHQLDLVADVCNSVVIVDRGRVVLQGEVAALRARSPTRYLDIEFAEAATWQPRGVPVASSDGRRYRVRLARGDDASDLISSARDGGVVVGYSFAPPDLSEVFLDAVGRASPEPADAEPAWSAP
jgi:ABC-2 type transport system ATP-binding protein